MEKQRILVIAGPTAVGKTEYAIHAAIRFNGEIVSCDSMQLYKYMNIGSAKPTVEERKKAAHHLVDFFDPREDFSVAQYQVLARQAIHEIASRGMLPIISGGTGLYLNSILYEMDFGNAPKNSNFREELEKRASADGSSILHDMLKKADPEAASKIHPNNKKKLIRALERLSQGETKLHSFKDVSTPYNAYDPLMICLTRDRNELYGRIDERVDTLIDAGLVEEVADLMKIGLLPDNISMKGIGYKEIIEYLEGNMSLDDAIIKIKKNTRHYAKRQLTWFRRYDKMKWVNLSEYLNDEQAKEEIERWLEKNL